MRQKETNWVILYSISNALVDSFWGVKGCYLFCVFGSSSIGGTGPKYTFEVGVGEAGYSIEAEHMVKIGRKK